MKQKNIHVRIIPKHSKKTEEDFLKLVKDKNGKSIGNMFYWFITFFGLFKNASNDRVKIIEYAKRAISFFNSKKFKSYPMDEETLIKLLKKCSIVYDKADLSKENLEQMKRVATIWLRDLADSRHKSYGTALSANRPVTEFGGE
jgi:hypothetical protein